MRRVRGRFASSGGERGFPRVLGVTFGVALPALFVYVLLREGGIPRWPPSGDQWALLVVTVASVPLGLMFWRHADYEYGFTGDEIVYRRRGRVRWRVRLASVERAEETFEGGVPVWRLHVAGRAFAVINVATLVRHVEELRPP